MDGEGERGQALPLALGGAFVSDRCGAGLGCDCRRDHRQGTGPAGGGPGGDLGGAIDARRPSRGCSRRRACQTASPNPRHLEKAAYLPGRAGRRSTLRGQTVCRQRGCESRSPTRARSRRCRPRLWSRQDRGRPRRLRVRRLRRWRKPAAPSRRRANEASTTMADGWWLQRAARHRQGHGMRPDVAAAFDRMAAAASQVWPRPDRQLGLSLRRRTGGPVCRSPRPHLGGASRALAAPLRDRARPWPGNRLRLAGCQRRPLRLRAALQLGGLALRL